MFNLEGKVEFGGQLRIVELDEKGWHVVELENCQPITENVSVEAKEVETVEEAVAYLRKNKFVQEKNLGENISSFNFTREAFYKGNWNKQTVLARGLFIDVAENKIMARSYEKFFKVNEVRETELASLKNKFVFPVQAYVKENGFLAIVSYDYKHDDLFVASKSTNKGDYVDYIKAQLEPYRENILETLRDEYLIGTPRTLVFECIDTENDPHIIEYNKSTIVLLDVIFNELEFISNRYEDVINTARHIGCPVKEKAYELKDWDAFRDLYMQTQDEEYKYNEEYIEGFVFVDQKGFMTKCKTGYYNLWKKLRGVADTTLRCGYITKTGMLTTAIENLFYGFCKKLYENDYDRENKTYPYKTDIISLRNKFLSDKN